MRPPRRGRHRAPAFTTASLADGPPRPVARRRARRRPVVAVGRAAVRPRADARRGRDGRQGREHRSPRRRPARSGRCSSTSCTPASGPWRWTSVIAPTSSGCGPCCWPPTSSSRRRGHAPSPSWASMRQRRRPRPAPCGSPITGYGRDGDGAGRVAFGDDAAVAGGLVAGTPDRARVLRRRRRRPAHRARRRRRGPGPLRRRRRLARRRGDGPGRRLVRPPIRRRRRPGPGPSPHPGPAPPPGRPRPWATTPRPCSPPSGADPASRVGDPGVEPQVRGM